MHAYFQVVACAISKVYCSTTKLHDSLILQRAKQSEAARPTAVP